MSEKNPQKMTAYDRVVTATRLSKKISETFVNTEIDHTTAVMAIIFLNEQHKKTSSAIHKISEIAVKQILDGKFPVDKNEVSDA